MGTGELVRVAVVALLGIGAMLGFALRAPAGNAPTPPPQTNCGDMAGPVWHVLAAGEQRGATGGHYTVTAINMPCAKARTLTAKGLQRDDSPRLHVPEHQCAPRLALLHRGLRRRDDVHHADAGRSRVQLAPL